MKTAREIMTSTVLSVRPETDIQTLTQLLRSEQISGVPVLDKHAQPIGVVSLYDVAFLGEREADPNDRQSQYWGGQSHLPKGYHALPEGLPRLTVGDIMTSAVYSVDESALLPEICEFFVRGQIHRVLVTKEGELSGIITSTDIIRELVACVIPSKA